MAIDLNREAALRRWVSQGVLEAREGRHERALECTDEALRIAPDLALIWFNRGNALQALRRDDEALAAFARACELDPEKPQPWTNRGRLLDDLGRFAEAVECYSRAVRLDPHDAVTWCNYGNTLSSSGSLREAVLAYQRALQCDPLDGPSHASLGETLARLGRYEEAIVSLEAALRIQPDNKAAKHNLLGCRQVLARSLRPNSTGRVTHVCCKRCRSPVTLSTERVRIQGAESHAIRIDARDATRLLCFRDVPGGRTEGRPETKDSWFQGYAWSVTTCNTCGTQLGFAYSRGPEGPFYGLFVERILD